MSLHEFQAILGFKKYLQRKYPEYTEGNIEVKVSLIKQEDILRVPIQLDTSDINYFKVVPIWEDAGLSVEDFKDLGLWGKYSTGYNYKFEFSEDDNSLTIYDGTQKILIFK